MTDTPVATKKTPFVTIIAWVFIALATMILFSSLIQFAVVGFLNFFSVADGNVYDMVVEELKKSMKDSEMLELAMLGLKYAWVLVTIIFIYGVTLMVTSIALLKRREWARKTMIGLLVLAIIYELGDLAWQFYVWSGTMMPLDKEIPGFGSGMMAIVMSIVTVLILAFVALFAWVIYKLGTEKVKQEFRQGSNQPAG